jgi:hypothetical protein
MFAWIVAETSQYTVLSFEVRVDGFDVEILQQDATVAQEHYPVA